MEPLIRAPWRLRRCRAAAGRACALIRWWGRACWPALAVPGTGQGDCALNFPWSDLPAAGRGARRTAVPVRIGVGLCCRFPVLFALPG